MLLWVCASKPPTPPPLFYKQSLIEAFFGVAVVVMSSNVRLTTLYYW